MSNRIRIAEPCHENWGNMTSSERGRFCASCEKEVVDFTSQPRAEIINYLSTSTGNTCGRFRSSQLDEVGAPDCTDPQVKRLKFHHRLKSAGWSMLALFGFTFAADEEAVAQDRPMYQGKVVCYEEPLAINHRKIIIKGQVSDDFFGANIPRANITLSSNGTPIADTFTDKAGNYQFEVEAGKITDNKFTLTAYAADYGETQLADLPLEKETTTVNITFASEIMIMGEVAPPEEEQMELREVEEHPVSEPDIAEESLFLGQAIVLEEPVQTEEVMVMGDTVIIEQEEITVVNDREPQEELTVIELEEPAECKCLEEEELTIDATLIDPTALVPEDENEVVTENINGPAVEPPLNEGNTMRSEEGPNEHITGAKMKVYPNPATDLVNIELVAADRYQVEVFDQAGRHVITEEFEGTNCSIDASALARGIYSVRVLSQTGDYASSLQLAVQR